MRQNVYRDSSILYLRFTILRLFGHRVEWYERSHQEPSNIVQLFTQNDSRHIIGYILLHFIH